MRFSLSLILIALAVTGMCQAQSKILVHGHRGARAVLPENTIPAFEHAIEAGADVIELDLAVTRDNVPVVSHDPVLKETLCQGDGPTRVIREMTLAELKRWDCGSLRAPGFPRQQPVHGARIPTLDEVLSFLADNRPDKRSRAIDRFLASPATTAGRRRDPSVWSES